MKGRSPLWKLSFFTLVLLYFLTLIAPMVAPYSNQHQFRDFFYSPPNLPRFRDQQGNWSLRPFVYAMEREEGRLQYRVTGKKMPLYFWVEGDEYSWMGLGLSRHLFGVSDPESPVFLLGSDALGRDLLSRLLYGAQFSLTIGFVGIALTLLVGVVIGSIAGYCGGWPDSILMRLADLFLSLPGLFLVMGIRAIFPWDMSIRQLYWMIVLIFSLIGWASVARVIRGQVLSLKTRQYVAASRAAGASHWRLLRYHILPFTSNYLLVQGTILIPAFILGEVTLSFLGLGVQEPHSSWGFLLVAASNVSDLTGRPWLATPAVLIFITVLAFNLVGEELKSSDRAKQLLWD